MFGKRGKAETKPVVSATSEGSGDSFRESILSSWAVEPLVHPQSHADVSKRNDEKRGFVFCRKCFELIAAKEMKCPNCGAANSRN